MFSACMPCVMSGAAGGVHQAVALKLPAAVEGLGHQAPSPGQDDSRAAPNGVAGFQPVPYTRRFSPLARVGNEIRLNGVRSAGSPGNSKLDRRRAAPPGCWATNDGSERRREFIRASLGSGVY